MKQNQREEHKAGYHSANAAFLLKLLLFLHYLSKKIAIMVGRYIRLVERTKN